MEYIKGPTPKGGAYAHIYFLDDNKKTATKETATNGHIIEFDENGNRICETHFIINKKNKQNNNEEIEKLTLD